MLGWIVLAVGLVVVTLIAGLYLFSSNLARKVNAGMPPAGTLHDVEGGRIHAVEKGEGPPVVLIHGLFGNLLNFNYGLIDELARSYHVIALDRPGCGWSERDSDARARLPEQAAMIARYLEERGVGPALICGHSLGGALSLTLALNHPERVAGLAMLSPLTAEQPTPPDVFKPLQISSGTVRRLVAHTLAMPMSVQRGDATLDIVFGPETAPADFRSRGGGYLTLRPREFVAAATDLMSVPEDMPAIIARYGELDLPMGMLYGLSDRVLDAHTHIAAIQNVHPDLDLEVHEAVGHMPLVTQVDTCLAFIRRQADRAFGE